jgi:hypothetical protein
LNETWRMPLSNLRLEPVTTLDLGDSKILPLDQTDEEIQAIVGLATHRDDFLFPMPKFDYLLETTGEGSEYEATMLRALTIFRLFKDALVLSDVLLVGERPRSYTSFRHFIPWAREQIEVYCLRGDEQAEFERFWRELGGMKPASFPLYRFTLADFRPYLYDRFVDYVESLECLLVPDSREGEMRYKFASRGAVVLDWSEDHNERKEIYHELKDAYDIRSDIVHGNVPDETKLTLGETRVTKWEDANRIVREYDRKAILFFHRAGCLERAADRRKLLESKLIFEAKIGLPR